MFVFLKKMTKNVFDSCGYEIRRKAPVIRAEPGMLRADCSRGFRRIHYACGSRLFKDWLNVDLFARNCVDSSFAAVNLVGPHPFSDNWFEFGYAEDFLEHLTQSESLFFLSEVYRTFQKGGVLRLSFPGLEGVLKRHYREATHAGASAGEREAYSTWGHNHFYSREELALVCNHLGFSNISFVQYGASVHDALKDLDYRSGQLDLNIYAEITK